MQGFTAVYKSTPATLTDGQQAQPLCDSKGRLSVALDGTVVIGTVDIDQTAPGTTDSVTVATAQGAGAAIGATSGAAVVTDATGTIQQYLRGLVKRWADALGAGTAAAALRTTLASDDPAVATLGATTGAAVITDANGTIQQYVRGLVKLIAAKITVGIDQTTPGTTNAVVASPVALSTATHSNVTSANADTTLLAANASRKPGSSIANDSTAVLYIKLGTGASASSYMAALDPKNSNGVPGVFNVPDGWTGVIDGFWSAANGSARVTEMT